MYRLILSRYGLCYLIACLATKILLLNVMIARAAPLSPYLRVTFWESKMALYSFPKQNKPLIKLFPLIIHLSARAPTLKVRGSVSEPLETRNIMLSPFPIFHSDSKLHFFLLKLKPILLMSVIPILIMMTHRLE